MQKVGKNVGCRYILRGCSGIGGDHKPAIPDQIAIRSHPRSLHDPRSAIPYTIISHTYRDFPNDSTTFGKPWPESSANLCRSPLQSLRDPHQPLLNPGQSESDCRTIIHDPGRPLTIRQGLTIPADTIRNPQQELPTICPNLPSTSQSIGKGLGNAGAARAGQDRALTINQGNF